MIQSRNLSNLQQNAAKKRDDKLEQYMFAWHMLIDESTDTDILISLEREFFINRKQSTERLETARTDLIKLDNW